MSDSWQDSVVRIENSTDKNSFGTGFPIYHQGIATYIATCAHVVGDIGQDNLRIFGKSATLAVPILEGIDLAVLRVELNRDVFVSPLPVRHAFSEFGTSFTTAGYLRAGEIIIIRALDGVFEKQIGVGKIGQRQLTKAWDIKIVDENPLQRGYSGSPVVDKNDYVVGVVTTLQGDGKKGIAIAAEALESVMKNAPWKQLMDKDLSKDLSEEWKRDEEQIWKNKEVVKFLQSPYRLKHHLGGFVLQKTFFTPPVLIPFRLNSRPPLSWEEIEELAARAVEVENPNYRDAFSNCWNKPQENVDLKHLEDLLCQFCITHGHNEVLLLLLSKFGLWPIFDVGRSTGFTLLTVPDKFHLDKVIRELDLSRAEQRTLFLAAGYTEKTPGCWLD